MNGYEFIIWMVIAIFVGGCLVWWWMTRPAPGILKWTCPIEGCFYGILGADNHDFTQGRIDHMNRHGKGH